MIKIYINNNINDIKIKYFYWINCSRIINKTREIVLLRLTISEKINSLINTKLYFDNEILKIKLFNLSYKIQRYFNCQNYRHIIKYYRFKKKCKWYKTKNHDKMKCKLQNLNNKKKYVNCTNSYYLKIIKYFK